MRERGVVIAVAEGRALVEVTPAEGCGKHCACSAVEGKAHLRRVEIDAPEGVQPGALVTLEVNSGQLLGLSAVVFLGPIACFVLGAVLSKPLVAALALRINADFGMLLGGAAGFLVGLGAVLLVSRRGAQRGWLKPRIVEVEGDAS